MHALVAVALLLAQTSAGKVNGKVTLTGLAPKLANLPVTRDMKTCGTSKPDEALEMIAEIPLDQPLVDRLTEAADALSAHLERMGAIAGALHGAGRRGVGGFSQLVVVEEGGDGGPPIVNQILAQLLIEKGVHADVDRRSGLTAGGEVDAAEVRRLP